MRIGVLGTGVVGQTIGTKLAQLGHDVRMGSRAAVNEKAVKWAKGEQIQCAFPKARVVKTLNTMTAARGMEMLLPIWFRLKGVFKTPNINVHIARP
jgi:predicted dinucleotide-binding enzyme